MDADGVAVGITEKEGTAGHVVGIADGRRGKAVRNEVLAERGQVGRVHREQDSLRGRIGEVAVFGAFFFLTQKHDGAVVLSRGHAGPAWAIGAALGVAEAEAEELIESDGAGDIPRVQHGSGPSGARDVLCGGLSGNLGRHRQDFTIPGGVVYWLSYVRQRNLVVCSSRQTAVPA